MDWIDARTVCPSVKAPPSGVVVQVGNCVFCVLALKIPAAQSLLGTFGSKDLF